MLTALGVGFLLLQLLLPSPNHFSVAAEEEDAVGEDLIEYDDQEGIDPKDLVDKNTDQPKQDADKRPEPSDYQQPAEDEEDLMALDGDAMSEESRPKQKRWLWSKKKTVKDDRPKSSWIFNTMATESARMGGGMEKESAQVRASPSEVRARARAAENFGQELRGGIVKKVPVAQQEVVLS